MRSSRALHAPFGPIVILVCDLLTPSDTFLHCLRAGCNLVELQLLLAVVALNLAYLLIYAGSGGPCFD